VLDATLLPVLADKIERKTGQLECHVLPHQHLDHSFANTSSPVFAGRF
jgi:hypothetical protein